MSDRILSVEGVTVSFDGFKVLDSLDFAMDYGELRFLIGPNGAGKTTLLDLITGKTRPASGRIFYDGRIDVTRHQEHDLVRLGIGRKFQTPAVFGSLTVFENLEVALGFRSNLLSLVRRLKGSDRDRIFATLEKVGLADRGSVVARTLSHGEQQWLEIAILLVQDPKLVLLDEPIAGMTRREREKTGQLLHTLEESHSILVVEHDMEFVREFSRTVTVLHLGKLLSEGPMEKVQADPQVVEVYLGRGKERAA
jgi:urea transport system ATP-binding protein